MLFLDAVSIFKSLKNEKQKRNKVKEIYKLYLNEKAPKQINVKKQSVMKINEIIKKKWVLRNDIFNEITIEVHDLLKDSYSRFRETKLFKEHPATISFRDVDDPDDEIFTIPIIKNRSNSNISRISEVLSEDSDDEIE